MSAHHDFRIHLRRSLLGWIVVLVAMLPSAALALRINAATDPALTGALIEDFDSATVGYFGSQDFLIGTDGFTVSAVSNDLHIDSTFCSQFGTSGGCLDTLSDGAGANDDFDVVFTGAGVTAFGFALNALDNDWTVETYDTNDNLLNSYVITSQSPLLTGFDRRGYFGATETAPIQYFTVRSTGDDRALIDDFAYVPVPEPNLTMLLGLGLLTLAGSRWRDPSR